ncbi:uncharacterized protein TNCV_4313311 [Trichonephila clavipes]|nr:uncharacterized protein TNCV_4313311 [Trichonephila clavipes]
MKVKLPKLIIPKFYGEINQRLSFWNSFKTAIHDNNSLNSIDKFTYLKGLLGSSALATVEGFAITAENYAKAVEILKDRFGRKDAIINSHMQKLLSVTPLKRSDDTKVLRQFFDMCQTQIRSLESLDVSFESFSNVLGKILGGPTAVFGAKNFSPKSAKLKVFKKASMTKNSWEAHASAGDEMGVSQR